MEVLKEIWAPLEHRCLVPSGFHLRIATGVDCLDYDESRPTVAPQVNAAVEVALTELATLRQEVISMHDEKVQEILKDVGRNSLMPFYRQHTYQPIVSKEHIIFRRDMKMYPDLRCESSVELIAMLHSEARPHCKKWMEHLKAQSATDDKWHQDGQWQKQRSSIAKASHALQQQ